MASLCVQNGRGPASAMVGEVSHVISLVLSDFFFDTWNMCCILKLFWILLNIPGQLTIALVRIGFEFVATQRENVPSQFCRNNESLFLEAA